MISNWYEARAKSPIAFGVIFTVTLLLFLGSSDSVEARNSAFRETAHGDLVNGPQRVKERQRGSCIQCHDQHSSHKKLAPGRNKAGLFAPDDNELCFSCHTKSSASGFFPGAPRWSRATHATEANVVRGQRPAGDANLCVNCHDPHGVRDANGLIPAMLTDRQTDLCVDCHDGSRASDVRSQLLKPFLHGTGASGSHQPHEDDDLIAAHRSYDDSNRHVTCSDCHNVHVSTEDRTRPVAPDASRSLAGVSRVEVINGLAGAVPLYRFHPADEPGPVSEYEICFKCHSSWTRLPMGRADIARLTNPQNPSSHPIQASGRNSRIAPDSFTSNWMPDSMILCTDCHASDDRNERGLHGSSYPFLLKKPAATSSLQQAPARGDLCFDCHSYDVYADASSPELTLRASRFNDPAGKGHAFHVETQQIACFACHDSHGSTSHASLIVTRRVPGILSYIQTPIGGTCTSSCHDARSYTLNYPR